MTTIKLVVLVISSITLGMLLGFSAHEAMSFWTLVRVFEMKQTITPYITVIALVGVIGVLVHKLAQPQECESKMTTIKLAAVATAGILLGMFLGFAIHDAMSFWTLVWVLEMTQTVIPYIMIVSLVGVIVGLVHTLAQPQNEAAAVAPATSTWSEEDETLLRDLIKEDLQSNPSNT
jgi:type III secretory pathway component EscS